MRLLACRGRASRVFGRALSLFFPSSPRHTSTPSRPTPRTSDGALHVWDLALRRLATIVQHAHSSLGAYGLSSLPNAHVLSLGRDASLVLWQLRYRPKSAEGCSQDPLATGAPENATAGNSHAPPPTPHHLPSPPSAAADEAYPALELVPRMCLEQFGGLGYCRLATLRSPLGLIAAAAQASPHAIALARVDMGGQTLRSFRTDTLRRADANSADTAESGGTPREESGGMILAIKLIWRPAAEAEGGDGRLLVVAGHEDGSLALWDLGADGQGKGEGGLLLARMCPSCLLPRSQQIYLSTVFFLPHNSIPAGARRRYSCGASDGDCLQCCGDTVSQRRLGGDVGLFC